MSHQRLKTEYFTEGSYGSLDKKTLYVDHNNSSDYITFYDSDGAHLLTIPDTIDNNLLDAINRLYVPNSDDGNLKEGIERMNEIDRKHCKI